MVELVILLLVIVIAVAEEIPFSRIKLLQELIVLSVIARLSKLV